MRLKVSFLKFGLSCPAFKLKITVWSCPVLLQLEVKFLDFELSCPASFGSEFLEFGLSCPAFKLELEYLVLSCPDDIESEFSEIWAVLS